MLIQCLTALYGTMVALLLYYKKFVKSLKSKGFKLNPYDQGMANKQVKEEQLTVYFQVDDCEISHLLPKLGCQLLSNYSVITVITVFWT